MCLVSVLHVERWVDHASKSAVWVRVSECFSVRVSHKGLGTVL